MLKIGIVGVGFMGWIHWLAYQKNADAEIVAICTKEEHRLAGDWTDIKGNFGPPGEKVDLTGTKTFDELDDMLADDSIEMVDICLPPALHTMAIEKAAAAGKHVFCEKPLALTMENCDAAVAACAAKDRMLMVGHVLPFFPEYKKARQIIDSGEYGELLGGSFKRVISDPNWLQHFYDPAKIGGPLFDLHVHDAHFIRLLFGMPESVHSCGRIRGEVVDYCNTIFCYDNAGYSVIAESGVVNQQGRPFTHGFEIHLEKCTMQFEFAGFVDHGETMPLKILKEDGTVMRPDLGDPDPVRAFEAEISEVVSSVKQGTVSPLLSGDLARDAIRLCHAQSESVKTRQVVNLD